MMEYAGPTCVLCGVKACTAEPKTKTPPDFCPMPEEAELLAEVEQTYLERDDIKRLALSALSHRIVVSAKYSSPGNRSGEAEEILAEILQGIEIPL